MGDGDDEMATLDVGCRCDGGGRTQVRSGAANADAVEGKKRERLLCVSECECVSATVIAAPATASRSLSPSLARLLAACFQALPSLSTLLSSLVSLSLALRLRFSLSCLTSRLFARWVKLLLLLLPFGTTARVRRSSSSAG